LLNNPRTPDEHDSQHGSLLGPRFNHDEIQRCLDAERATFEEVAAFDRAGGTRLRQSRCWSRNASVPQFLRVSSLTLLGTAT